MTEILRNKILLLLLFMSSSIVVFSMPPMAQDLNYHQFADQRSLLGIANAFNVLSNLPFLLVGLWGLYQSLHKQRPVQIIIFCSGVALVAVGSAYYHYLPGNNTLLWDRLPMTVAFMGLFSFLVREKIDPPFGDKLLGLLVFLGVASVLYWHVSELKMIGDLRPYILVQFFPMLAIVMLLWISSQNKSLNKAFYALLTYYLLAKAAEYFDRTIFEQTQFISGHSLKHLLAAAGVFQFLRIYFNHPGDQSFSSDTSR